MLLKLNEGRSNILNSLKIMNLTFSVTSSLCDKLLIGKNILEDYGAANGIECNCCIAMDIGEQETVAKK